MAASERQRGAWVIALLVAVIGALGAIGANVIPRLLPDNPASQSSSSSDAGNRSGSDVPTTPTPRIAKWRIPAEAAVEQSSEMQVRNDGGVAYLAYISSGAWALYDAEGLGAGTVRSITARVASDTEGGVIDIRLDGEGGQLIGQCPVRDTGGWLAWHVVTCDIRDNVASAPSRIQLEFSGASTRANPYLFNLDWVELS